MKRARDAAVRVVILLALCLAMFVLLPQVPALISTL